MARQPRIIYPGAYYHVMARGNQRHDIVRDDEDREMFLATMGEAVGKTGWEILAFVLMSNHYHWVMRTPEPNLVEGMKWFQNTYTRRFAARHSGWGHLFGGRYKAIVVDPERDETGRGEYLPALMDYVHLNPVRAGLVRVDEGLGLLGYRWSSLATGYGVPASRRLSWLAVDGGLELAGLGDTVANRREYLRRLEQRARLEGRKACGITEFDGQGLQSTLRRGWYWGSQAFGEGLAKGLRTVKNRTYRSSALMKKRRVDEAAALLEEGLRHFALSPTDVWNRKNYPSRAAIAWALTRRTSAPQAWIAQQLGLSNAANVSQLTRRFESELPHKKIDRPLKAWIKMSRIAG